MATRRRRLLFVVGLSIAAIFVVAAAPRDGDAPKREVRAEAVLVNADGERVGVATFAEGPEGLQISVSVDGLDPGRLGLHVHENSQCDPPTFESAGGHFAPNGSEHGAENQDGPHAGDLPNLRVGENGKGANDIVNPMLSLTGDASLLGDGGTSLIVHEQTDDYYTDPSGDAGNRIACGVIAGA